MAHGQNYYPSLVSKKTPTNKPQKQWQMKFGEGKNKVVPVRRKISLHIPWGSLKLLQPLVILDSFIQDSHAAQQRSKNTVTFSGEKGALRSVPPLSTSAMPRSVQTFPLCSAEIHELGNKPPPVGISSLEPSTKASGRSHHSEGSTQEISLF